MRRKGSQRLKNFDYSNDQWYFVTSCIRNNSKDFGKIIDGKMDLSKAGQIALEQWNWLATQYPYVKLHEFVVMPDHIHGILEINATGIRYKDGAMKIKSLSDLIGAYKTTASKKIHLITSPDGTHPYKHFRWLRSFHERIVWTRRSFENISEYIRNNPKNYHRP